MPPKVRHLVAELELAGFVNRGGRGGHRNYAHPKVLKPITISGKMSDGAKSHQVESVQTAVEEKKNVGCRRLPNHQIE